MSGMTSFVLAQDQFRFYEDNGTNATQTEIAAVNTNIVRATASPTLCLRVLLQESGGASGASTDDFQLQVSKNGGSYVNVTTTSSNVKAFDSVNLTDGGSIGSRLSGSGSSSARVLSEDGLVDNQSVTALTWAEFLYTLELVPADLADNDTLDFRVLHNGATFTYNVTPRITVDKPSPPTFTSAANASVAENATLAKSITVDISSTFALSGSDAADFELTTAGPATSTTLRWAGNGTKDFEAPDDTGTNNVYDVTVEATANSLTTTQNNAITVTNVSPTITNSNTATVSEHATLSKSLTVSSGTPSWSIVGGADAAHFEISGSTLRWLSNGTKDFEAPGDDGTNNTYVVTVRATVSGESADQTITVTVTNVAPPSATEWAGSGGYGSELVTNGTFNSDASGWTIQGNGSVSLGRLTVTDEGAGGFAQQALVTEASTLYEVSVTGSLFSGASPEVEIGTGTTLITRANLADEPLVEGTPTVFQFTASGVTTYITLNVNGSFGQAAFDDVSVREVLSASDPEVASDAADATHVGNTNKTYHASNFAIVGGTNSAEFELYDNAGTLAVRTNGTPLTAGTSTVQIRDTTNGAAGSGEDRTDTLSITVTGVDPNGNASGAMGATVTMSAMGASFSAEANASGATGALVTLSPMDGSAGTSAQASGALSGVTLSALGATTSGEAAISPTLVDVTVTALDATGSGDGAATGALQTITMSSLTGGAVGEAGASGLLTTVTVSALEATTSGDAAIEGALGTTVITVNEMGATAGVSANISASLSPVVLSAMSGSGSGEAAASGTLVTISLTALGATVIATAEASGALQTVTLSAMDAAATGGHSAQATGTLTAVTVSAMDATSSATANISPALTGVVVSALSADASGAATAGGALQPVAVSMLEATVTGGGSAAGELTTVTVTPLTGTASTEDVANATGLLGATITVSTFGAVVSAEVNVSGLLSGVVVSAMEADASGAGGATGSFQSVTLTGLAGAATGGAAASGSPATVIVTPLDATGTGYALTSPALPSVTVTPMFAQVSAAVSINAPLTNVTLTAMSADASGGAGAAGSFTQVTLTSLDADATGTAQAAGALGGVVVMTALDGRGIGLGSGRPWGYAYVIG